MPLKFDTPQFTVHEVALAKISYKSWTEIFMHPVPRGIPILDTTIQVTAEIVQAREHLENCCQEVGR